MLVVAVAAAGGAASSAQAAVEHTVYARGDVWSQTTLAIAVGDTVRWINEDGTHNLILSTEGEIVANAGPESDGWNPPPQRAFTSDATVYFVCSQHTAMTGTIKVGTGGGSGGGGGTGGDGGGTGGDGGGTGTGGDGGGTGTGGGGTGTGGGSTGGGSTGGGSTGGGTPQPGGTVDATRPAVSALRAKRQRRAAKLSFRLSEASSVTITVKRRGARKPVKTIRTFLRAGLRTVTVKRLRAGRYTFEVTARDAAGNRSARKRASLRFA